MNADPENMNLATAARYLGTSSVKVKRLLQEREIPASKIRGRWILRKSLLDAWQVRNSASPVADQPKIRKHKSFQQTGAMHPALARLLVTLDKLDFSDLEPRDWDQAQKFLAKEEVERSKKLIALAEQGE